MAGRIGAHGRRVIEAIEQGRTWRRTGDGWRAGPLLAPDSLVAELNRNDLVREENGRLVLTPAGRGFGARTARPESANRLLVDRPLPQDGERRFRGASALKSEAGSPQGDGRTRTRSVTVNLAESPLGWLKARGMVSERQFDAGERLRGDWTVAGLGPRVTMRWDAAPAARGGKGPGAALDPTLAQIAAKRRFEGAMDAVGTGLRDVLWRVACAGEGLETAEKALGWPKRAAKLVLLMALDRVADHYRVA